MRLQSLMASNCICTGTVKNYPPRLRGASGSGVATGQAVGLWSERSAEGWIEVLGILANRGTLCSLPSDSPPDRLAAIIADADVRFVRGFNSASLARRHTVGGIRACLGRSRKRRSRPGRCASRQLPDSPFAIIYTSGSTGVPKGVCLRTAVSQIFLWHRTRGRFEPGDFALSPLTTPWHFDGSIVQMFSPLITGGTLVICGRVSDLGTTPWYHQLTALTGALLR